jgi:hypothetical protein
MFKLSYMLFIYMCMTVYAGGRGVDWVDVCVDCVEYNPQHWQDDGFPPIIMIRNVK